MLTELDLRKVAIAGAFDDLRRDTMATMAHYSRVLKVVIDAPPDLHDQELAFWQGALGQELPESYSAEYHGAFLRGNDLMLLMQRLESGAPRVHLDIHTDDLDAEVARLERLGAERVQKVQTWWTPPIEPAFPKPLVVIPVGVGAGLVLGLLLALLAEATDRRVRFPVDLEYAASGPFLGSLDAVRRARARVGASRRILRPA